MYTNTYIYIYIYIYTRVPSCNARKKMKHPEKNARKEPLDGAFGNPFWWKQSEGPSSQNYQKEMTRKNHHDSWSKQHKANRREKARAFVDTLDRPSLRGRAFVDTLDSPFLRGRAFVDALGSLGDALEALRNGPSLEKLWKMGHHGANLGPT